MGLPSDQITDPIIPSSFDEDLIVALVNATPLLDLDLPEVLTNAPAARLRLRSFRWACGCPNRSYRRIDSLGGRAGQGGL